MKKGEVYKGFEVIDIKKIPGCASKGVYLIHKESGLEVFHLVNKDPENLFAFAFNTPSKDSTGAAHVLEHSVLCGSKKYPLKDPFLQLANQSINTYLNAYTASDRTVFPASSPEKSDYFNLMSVYADAVFFPLLKEEIFSQECCRVEYDEKNTPSLQGVVYNEMKGVYSSFDSVVSSEDESSLSRGTIYEYDSGGNPFVIPTLTHKALKAFHKKYYCTSNCRVFLYGNIPTEEQLDFLYENVIARCRSYGKPAVMKSVIRKTPAEHFVEAYGPCEENSDRKSVSNINWKISKEEFRKDISRISLEVMFLSDLLWGDDCAPVTKALLESGLGDDISHQSGVDVNRLEPIITLGMCGVQKEKAPEVRKLILKVLEDVCRNGISKGDYERAVMGFEVANREVLRFNGPYSLVLMRRSLRGWCYGEKPWTTLMFADEFDRLKKRAAADENYITSLIKKYFLDNPDWSFVVTTPSLEWNSNRDSTEKKLLKERIAQSTVPELKAELKKMYDFQNAPVPEKARNCIPHLKVSSLKKIDDRIDTKHTLVDGISLFTNEENTNGITYADIWFPADVLKSSYYPYLPLFCECIVQCGWKDVDWNDALLKIQRTMGSLSFTTKASAVPECSSRLAREEPLTVGREWLCMRFKFLSEYAAQSFEIVKDCICRTDFSDTERIKTIINAVYANAASSIVSGAHVYAAMRSSCTDSRNGAVNEIWQGITQVFTLKKIMKEGEAGVAKKFRKIFSAIKKGGCLIHITSDSDGLESVKKLLPSFIKKSALVPLKKKRNIKDGKFYKLTELPGKNCAGSETALYDEVVIIPGTVGYASTNIKCSPYDTKEAMEDCVLTHYLETTDLWKKIRTEGGAYGVFFSANSISGYSKFGTYRDPKPFLSIDTFRKYLEEIGSKEIDTVDVEKSITGTYSAEIEPKSPATRGMTGIFRELYGFSGEQKLRRLEWLLKITPEDLRNAALRFEAAPKKGKTVVFTSKTLLSDKIEKKSGKIITLPL